MALLASRPRSTDRLLLHAGAGGVGLAAGEYAQWLRSRPSTTVGQPQKHRFLHHAGFCGRTLSSRDGGAFALGASAQLRGSRLRGVLNSLSADFIACSFALLGEDGCLCEIGKRAVWSYERHEAAAHSRYVAIALDSTMEQVPSWMCRTLRLLSSRAEADVLHGLPLRVFGLERGAQAAFRWMQAGSNIGKVVIRVPAAGDAAVEGSHVLTGGSGALGVVTGAWLSESGAGALVVASRGGSISASAGARLRSSGVCEVRAARCDAGEPSEVSRLFAGLRTDGAPPLRGVWHAAGVLADALLASQSAASLRRVFAPKAVGAWALHRVCAPSPVDACVLFSSIAAVLGGGGQANYAAANCCLDSLGGRRRLTGLARGERAVGPVGRLWHGCGSVNARLQAGGIGLIGLAQGVVAFKAALRPVCPSAMSLFPVRWGQYLGTRGGACPPAERLCGAGRGLVRRGGGGGGGGDLDVDSRDGEPGAGDAASEADDGRRGECGRASDGGGARLAGRGGARQPAAERSRVRALPSTLVFDYPTARQLAGYFAEQSAAAPAAAAAAARQRSATPVAASVACRA